MIECAPASPSRLLFTILFSQWMIQFGASWSCCWPSTLTFATSISHQHHHHAGIIIDCKLHCHHQQQQRIHSPTRQRYASYYSLGSSRGIRVFSSGSNDNIHENRHHRSEEQLTPPPQKGRIRLNKVFKATHSRREADALIESGRVRVNGATVEPSNVGMKVVPFQDVISLDGNVIYGWEAMNAIIEKNLQTMQRTDHHPHPHQFHEEQDDANHDHNNCNTFHDHQPLLHHQPLNNLASSTATFEYIKYYKPVGVTCTTDSRIKDNIIDDLIHNHGYRPRHRVYPVGRLDKETSGLILLTSDGRVVNSVLRGENKHPKVYHVMVNDSLTEEDMQRLRDGIVITTVSQRKGRSIEENTLIAKTKKAIVERIGHNSCRMTLVEGRNRQIRKMMEALGLRVVRLHRVEFMGIRLTTSSTSSTASGLKRPGDWAHLDEREMRLIADAIRLAQEKNENQR